MYQFETVIGTQSEKPKEIDTTSSQYVVYIRKDIEPYEKTESDGVTIKGWKYQELAIPNNDYLADYLKQTVESNEAIMLGLCDLYEQTMPTE